ncbi:hypothetical protein [Paractinoplanes rishiriensis]|uniref:Uncharacterized protein n=1 Tax=Paractinoplanes rishiriensis TaxID=1050105 RepID=A0A919MV95_9ACTN|nr:hypothetical protein [Actinoplanes rishiriensis]GIE96189.1 hypothetical protein Ari01nite_36540 [Actinoplanes rishiriensis]
MPAPAPPGFVDAQQSGEIPSSVDSAGPEMSRWADNRSRYADLLSQRVEPAPPPTRRPGLAGGGAPPAQRPGSGSSVLGERPGLGDRPGAGERPSALGERPGVVGERPAGLGERPAASGDLPGGAGERPAGLGERSGARPAGLGERSGGSGERSGGLGGRPGGLGERSGGLGERSGGLGERSGGLGERSGGLGERSGGLGERSGGLGERPVGLGERLAAESSPGERTANIAYPERPSGAIRRDFDVPTPSSAPPFPYEGDLDETASMPQPIQQRAAVPLVRPATPGGRWGGSEPAGPSAPVSASVPAPVSASVSGVAAAEEAQPARPSYDPSSFPRRISYDSAPGAESSGYVPPAAYAAFGSRPSTGSGTGGPADPGSRVLPQRVPAQPDVPRVPEPPLGEPTAETPALARIATHLRRGDVLQPQERQEGFDVQAILAAVRGVAGVRDASLRQTPTGAHSLRLDLAEGADPAEVSRRVARLLQDRMGLDAAMKGEAAVPSALVPTSATRPVSPPVATRPVSLEPPAPRPVSPAVRPASAPPVPVERDRRPAAVVPADVEPSPPRPLYPGDQPGPRVVIENVHVNTFGTEASVEVRLGVGDRTASGRASGPAVDGYLLRLCAMATAGAVDQILSTSEHPDGPGRCFVEHAAAVSFGSTQVAVVVLLLSCNGWVEQLSGSAVVTGDDRHAMVRATLAAVNRRLEALLSR